MERAAAEARYHEIHEKLPYHDGSFQHWSEKRTQEFPYHFMDGVRIWVSKDDEAPDDDFLKPPDPPRPAVGR